MRQLSAIPIVAVLACSALFGQEVESDGPGARPPAPARLEAEPPPPASEQPQNAWERWAKFKGELRDRYGTELSLNLDAVGRSAVAGPETLERAIARYDLLLRQHFGDDALVSMDVRGGWGDGLDPYLGLFSNTDQYAQTGEQIFILHLYYQQQLMEDQVTLRVGKFDIGDWIDTNRYGFYNFLGYSFAHTGTIPLTGNTLGVMASWEPKEMDWFYISGGASNSEQTPYESGIGSTFGGDAEWLSIGEVGIKPKIMQREGIYRFIAWHNSRDFAGSSGDIEAGAAGFALSFDQDLTDKLGAFCRFGVVDGDPLEPKRYYSAGVLLKEPLPGRDKDSLALGFVINEFTDAFGQAAGAEDTERYVELYYNWQFTPWAQLQPVLQVVDNPGGTDRDTVVILGAHLALRF